MNPLEILTQHRDAILLAEVAAWLHDDFKHTDQQINKYVDCAPSPSGRQDTSDLIPAIEIILLGKSLKFSVVKNRKQEDFVDGYLNRCHYTAHIEKEDGDSKQTYPAYLSSPFGFEASTIPEKLTETLRNSVPWNLISSPVANRATFHDKLQELFSKVGGDTRRPGNEINLWEWGHTVGALYKAALAGALLGNQPVARDLRWRLLSIRTDGVAYLSTVTRLPDLIARQNVLKSALNNVQTLLEETYPLASEAYRDENGALFVVPDLPGINLLDDLQDSNRQTLRAHIQQQFATNGDVVAEICLDATAWWGQDPDHATHTPPQNEIPPAGRILAQQPTLQSDRASVALAWQNQSAEICPVCGLRPCANNQINICTVCGERRKRRVAEWMQAQNSTIWLDEVADSNGRLALLTGTFDLTDWLNGKLVETMLVRAPSPNPVTKTPSFARLRRVWRTTQQFWQESQVQINTTLADSRRRLQIKLANPPALTKHQVYEFDLLGHIQMSVMWDGNHLISTDNLSYVAAQLNIPATKRNTPADAALEVGAWLEQNKARRFQLISDDEKNRRFEIQIADVDYQATAYSTTIPILAEPRTFITLVPADKALDVIDAIKTKYEREMGKVRNRLPLHLGAVYFHRRTPLSAALDAGRRMLQQKPLGGDQPWSVQAITKPAKTDLPPNVTDGTQHFNQTVKLDLIQGDRALTWYVPTVMGDGVTTDNWYPYLFFHSDKDGNSDPRQCAEARACCFKGVRPGTSGECWLIHASQLKQGDQVYFTPATFDFQWLDTTARRFEIAYDEQGQRLGHATRPYLLDELATIQQVWDLIAGKDGLTSSQIYALRDLVEAKREEWGAGETFDQLCRDAVRNAQWKNRKLETLELITTAAISGLLTDVIELYMGILKTKPQCTEEDVVS